MLIRPMLIPDAHQVAAINVRAWQRAYAGIVNDAFLQAFDSEQREINWRRGLESQPTLILRFVAEGENDEGILGYVCGLENRSKDLLPDCDSELWAIYVDPARMRSGVGAALLGHFSSELKTRGLHRFAVWVLKDNQIGRAFYAKQGGKLSAAEKEVVIGGQTLVEVSYEFEL